MDSLRRRLDHAQSRGVYLSARGQASDPDDDKYLAAAIEGRATFVVTGDPDLLDMCEHEGVRIVNPRAFLDLL